MSMSRDLALCVPVDNIFLVDTVNVGYVDCRTADDRSVVMIYRYPRRAADRLVRGHTKNNIETMYHVFVFVFQQTYRSVRVSVLDVCRQLFSSSRQLIPFMLNLCTL